MADNRDAAFSLVCDVFGFRNLNEHQINALKFVIEKKQDVFVNLPTGFGKSVVFQALPLVYSCLEPDRENNIVIVVSPLVSLMKDQVSLLLSRGISATCLNNDMSETDKRRVESGQCSIIYGSPESWLGDTRWRKMLTSQTYKNSVRVVAVDEAHVICHW